MNPTEWEGDITRGERRNVPCVAAREGLDAAIRPVHLEDQVVVAAFLVVALADAHLLEEALHVPEQAVRLARGALADRVDADGHARDAIGAGRDEHGQRPALAPAPRRAHAGAEVQARPVVVGHDAVLVALETAVVRHARARRQEEILHPDLVVRPAHLVVVHAGELVPDVVVDVVPGLQPAGQAQQGLLEPLVHVDRALAVRRGAVAPDELEPIHVCERALRLLLSRDSVRGGSCI